MTSLPTAAPRPAAYRQGGDLRGLIRRERRLLTDLGTCVNPYGPPRSIKKELNRFDCSWLLTHPYHAVDVVAEAYAEYLGVDAADLTIGQGISGLLVSLAAALPSGTVATVTPDYTEIISRADYHLPPLDPAAPDTVASRLRRIRSALATPRNHVIISNPCNPLGIFIPPADLAQAALDYPTSVLIVDESYVDFTAAPAQSSLLGTNLTNIAVLRSPSKPLGIAGTRCGALWTRNTALRSAVARWIPAWPLSILDAAVVVAAVHAPSPFGRETWTQTTCGWLRDTAKRMETMLARIEGATVLSSPAHFRFVTVPKPDQLYDHLLDHGIVVRLFDSAQRGRIGGLRLSAPRDVDLPRLESALKAARDVP